MKRREKFGIKQMPLCGIKTDMVLEVLIKSPTDNTQILQRIVVLDIVTISGGGGRERLRSFFDGKFLTIGRFLIRIICYFIGRRFKLEDNSRVGNFGETIFNSRIFEY